MAAVQHMEDSHMEDSALDMAMQITMPTPDPPMSVVTTSASRRGKAPAPESVIPLRRSSRSNKYDGFKVPPLSDTKTKVSKVKPRVIPSAASTATISEPSATSEIPPPTTILVIQHIGTVMCGIPAE